MKFRNHVEQELKLKRQARQEEAIAQVQPPRPVLVFRSAGWAVMQAFYCVGFQKLQNGIGFLRRDQKEDLNKCNFEKGLVEDVPDDSHEEPPVPAGLGGDIRKVASTKQNVSISEMFSPDRVCARCELHGLVPGSSFDLHTGFDLGRYAVQREVEKAIDEEYSNLLIGSPPCTKFSPSKLGEGKATHRAAARAIRG